MLFPTHAEWIDDKTGQVYDDFSGLFYILWLQSQGYEINLESGGAAALGELAYRAKHNFQKAVDTTNSLTTLAGLKLYNGYLQVTNELADELVKFTDWLYASKDTELYEKTISTSYFMLNNKPWFSESISNNYHLPTNSLSLDTLYYFTLNGTARSIEYTSTGVLLYNGIPQETQGYSYTRGIPYHRGFIISRAGTCFNLHSWYPVSATDPDATIHYYTRSYVPIELPWVDASAELTVPDEYTAPVIGDNDSVYIKVPGVEADTVEDYITQGVDAVIAGATVTATVSNTSAYTSPDVSVNPDLTAFAGVWKYVQYMVSKGANTIAGFATVLASVPKEITWLLYGGVVCVLFGGIIKKLLQ